MLQGLHLILYTEFLKILTNFARGALGILESYVGGKESDYKLLEGLGICNP